MNINNIKLRLCFSTRFAYDVAIDIVKETGSEIFVFDEELNSLLFPEELAPSILPLFARLNYVTKRVVEF